MVNDNILNRLMDNINEVNKISDNSDYQELNRRLTPAQKQEINNCKMDNILQLSDILDDNLSVRKELGNDLFQLYKSLCYSIIREDYLQSSLIQKEIIEYTSELV